MYRFIRNDRGAGAASLGEGERIATEFLQKINRTTDFADFDLNGDGVKNTTDAHVIAIAPHKIR